MKFETFILLFSVLMLSIVTFALPSYASGSDPYDSGYDHGCDDAGISDSSERYINQPEKGPSFHTNAFMNGYYDGFDACSDNTGDSDSESNNGDNSNSRSSGQTENRGLLGNYADGHRAGLADGADDYRSGRSEFARCPGGSLDYCAGYNFGYHEGYDAARKVG